MSSFHIFSRTLLISIFFFIFFSEAIAQQTSIEIAGTVIDSQTKKPLVGASIYLNNTTRATTSAEDGAFTLKNIPQGNYQLIISYIGYASSSIKVAGQSANALKIELQPSQTFLNEVTIGTNPHWDQHFLLFQIFFLGKGMQQCTIENPKSLFFKYSKSYVLTAEASKPLIIDNQALGYRVYYELTSFVHRNNRTSYLGYTHFEEMKPANNAEEKKWKANRENAYYGSFTHFIRSLVNNQIAEDNFVVKRLTKAESFSFSRLILQKWKGDEFKSTDTLVSTLWNGIDYDPKDTTAMADTTKKWGSKAGYNILYPQTLSADSILAKTIIVGKYKLSFSNSLFITYKKKNANWVQDNQNQPGYPTSILTMYKADTFVDSRGFLADPNAVIQEGFWATYRVADQLPDDYEPDKTGH